MILDNVDIARVCHEANRELQSILGEATNPHWDDLDSDLKASGVDGVVAARQGMTAEQLHANWCEFREAQGWVHGETKDPEKRTHPCLVPYADLPLEQRLKDHLFRGIVTALSGDGESDTAADDEAVDLANG